MPALSTEDPVRLLVIKEDTTALPTVNDSPLLTNQQLTELLIKEELTELLLKGDLKQLLSNKDNGGCSKPVTNDPTPSPQFCATDYSSASSDMSWLELDQLYGIVEDEEQKTAAGTKARTKRRSAPYAKLDSEAALQRKLEIGRACAKRWYYRGKMRRESLRAEVTRLEEELARVTAAASEASSPSPAVLRLLDINRQVQELRLEQESLLRTRTAQVRIRTKLDELLIDRNGFTVSL